MALVREVMSGNCKVSFYDDCVVKTQEEIDAILETVADIYRRHLIKQALKELEDQK